MPIYEYRCKACGAQFEDIKLSSEDVETGVCPKCGKPEGERVMSVFATGGGGKGDAGSCSSSGPIT